MEEVFFWCSEKENTLLFLFSSDPRGESRIYFRRGCTRLLLYFNTNKPQYFFCRIPVVLENRRSSQGRGVRTPCTLPLDPPLDPTHFCSFHKLKKSHSNIKRGPLYLCLLQGGCQLAARSTPSKTYPSFLCN